MRTNAADKCTSRVLLRRAASGLLAATACHGGAVMGQSDAGPSAGAIEQIVVTARKVEESLQRVPVAVSAFSGEQLLDAGVSEIVDLQAQTPNLAFRANNESSGVFVVMRGQVQASGELNTDGPVGVYFDGVNMPRARGLGQAMFDVERVEILKGPQGTLYGRNTTGGTLNVISKKPSHADGVSGFVEGTMGTYDYVQGGAVLNLPLSDTFATRLAVQKIQRDGFGRQLLAERPDQDLDDENQIFVRASALWDPTDALQVHLVGDWKRVDEHARVLLHPAAVQNPAHLFYTALGVAAGLIDPADPATIGPGRLAAMDLYRSYISGNYHTESGDVGDTFNFFPPRGSVYDDYGFGLTATVRTDAFELTSLTGYRAYEISNSNDLDATPYVLFDTFEFDDQDFISQELRLDGSILDDRLDWLLGAFYSDETGYRMSYSVAYVEINPNNPGIVEGDFQNTSWAGFGQLGFTLMDSLRLTVGARFTEEKKEMVSYNRVYNSATPDPNDGTCRVPPAGLPLSACRAAFSDTWGKWSWLASLDYQVTDDVMIYVSGASSWRGGGQNSRGNTSTLSFASFAPETATNYEIGVKADWFANRLRTNLAVFYTDYEDVQRRRNITAGLGQSAVVLTNAAKAHIPGFEFDVEARPLEGLSLRASVGHVRPKYDEFFDINLTTLQPVDRSEEAFENVAEWTYTLDARYERHLADGVIGFGANWSWQDEIDNYLVVTDPTIPREAAIIDDYGLLNVRLDYRLEEIGWEVALWGRNVLDKEHLTRIQDTSTALGHLIAFPGTRALWGFEMRKRF